MRTAALFSIALAGFVSASEAAKPIWRPAVGASWQIILHGHVNPHAPLTPDVSIFDIDLETHSKAEIAELHNKGKKVICYFSAGSSEKGRKDNNRLENNQGNVLDGWPDERWLDTRSQVVRDVMKARIASAAEKGCDAVDPDNVDAFDNNNGLNLSEADAVDYVKFLAQEANAKGMGMGLKNAGNIVDRVLPYVDFSVQEQCGEQKNCRAFDPFIKAGKPVFNIEYVDDGNGKQLNAACPGNKGYSSVIKKMELDGWVQMCDGSTATTSLSSD